MITGARLAILPGIHGEYLGEAGVTRAGNPMPGITAALVEAFLNE
ncbi:MAG TPA: hypothetical protein VHC47_07895 [Mucilaginibacter sp.]|nr:hypothetical protein [Mucilaginibacter sp.]